MNKEKILIRIGGVVIVGLVFGLILGKFLPLPSVVIVGLTSAVYWFMQYDEQKYNERYNEQGDATGGRNQ